MVESPLTRLTPREREVLEHFAQGRTNAEIAHDLGRRFDTARWHVSEVLSKLGVASREDAAAVFRSENCKQSLPRRALAGIPAVIAVGTTSAAVVAGIVLLVFIVQGDSDPDEVLKPLVAYAEHEERNLLDQDPAPLRVINAHTPPRNRNRSAGALPCCAVGARR